MSLLERIEKVLEDTGWSAREWARNAELPEPTHLNTIIRRLRENPDTDISATTLAKLADAAGVSLDWLALGRGTKDGAFVRVEPDLIYPSRGVAVVAATAAGWSLDGIMRVRAMNSFESDPGLSVWMQLLASEAGGRQASSLPPGPSVSKKSGQRSKPR